MNSKKAIALIYSVSLTITSLSSLVLSITGLIGVDLPELVTRVIGVADLVALPFLIYSGILQIKTRSTES